LKTLALDTATAAASVAVIEDGKMLGVMTLNLKKPHSQKIMVVMEDLLKQLELKISDIDLFAAAHGPGSFTGLRVGIAAIKGFADSMSKPAVGVSTLEAMALPFLNYGTLVCPMIDARRDQAYYAVYKKNVQTEEIYKPDCQNIKNIICQLAVLNKPVVFTGACLGQHREYILSQMGDNAIFADELYCVNSAVAVGYIAEKKYLYKKESGIAPDYVLKAYTGND